jgi:hypothetical protein
MLRNKQGLWAEGKIRNTSSQSGLETKGREYFRDLKVSHCYTGLCEQLG